MDKRKAWNSHPLSGFDGGDTPSAGEEIQELARIIYGEAGGLSRNAKARIGWTVRNRLGKDGHPDTYHGVIHEEKNGIKQYDAAGGERWNEAADLDKLNTEDYMDYRQSYEIAEGVYNGTIPDSSGVEFFISSDPEKLTGFFKKAVDKGIIRQAGPTEEGMTFYRPTGKGRRK